jgi:glycosyltransferase involved in cell wall biosynthesis
MSNGGKRFLIVLPVRNGGELFKACVNSILAQSYETFRLVVLDNASNDCTVSWLRERDDPRVEVRDSHRQLSIEDSWARIKSVEAPGEFMTIIGHDDLLDCEYLANMCELIDQHPDAALYHAHFRLISEAGREIRPCLHMPAVEQAHEFLAARLAMRRDSFGTGYVFRCSDYAALGGIPLFKKLLFADDALWIALMNGSYKATHPKVCFSYRVRSASASYAPDWETSWMALNAYLEFLQQNARRDVQIAAAIRRNIEGFILFWFRRIYFSGNKASDREKAITLKIAELTSRVEGLLGPDDVPAFRARVKAALFRRLSHISWFAWRAQRYLKYRVRFLRATRP